jgi:hypothetical protein
VPELDNYNNFTRTFKLKFYYAVESEEQALGIELLRKLD